MRQRVPSCDLRQRTAEAVSNFPKRNPSLCPIECLSERCLVPKCPVEVRVTEVGPSPAILTAKGAAIGASGRHHEACGPGKRRDEAAGMAGRDDNHPARNAGAI